MQRNDNSFKKFYELDLDERLDYIQNETKIKKKDLQLLKDMPKNFSFQQN